MRPRSCGSWLACDADGAVYLTYGGDAIAGKPAPTFDRVSIRAFEVSVNLA
ncbi:hypothetical protein C4J94_5169 [Pseudomonas sp. R5-89-07]|nr:hypothetical protein C4J94_5169 [Pseudomonas sp. R5-89-07]